MDALIEIIELATAILVLATTIVQLMSEARGSNDREGKEEGR